MIFVRSLPTVLSAFGLLLLAGCGTNSVIQRSQKMASLGDYRHAYEVIDLEYSRQLIAGAIDKDIAKLHAELKLEWLRDRAQARIFAEREDAALKLLDELDRLDPDYPGTSPLRVAATLKKAERIVEFANEQLNRKEFTGAMESYLESQKLIPGYKPADDGIERVAQVLARMSARAQQQMLQAWRKYPDFRHIEVAWHAASVLHNTPDLNDEKRESALRLAKNAKHESALSKFQEAKDCELANQFGAALMLYRTALQLDPELAKATEAIAAMQKELIAVSLLERAQLAMRNDEFTVANELLKEAHDMSKLSRAQINDLMMQSRKLHGQKDYREALDLEVMGKKAEALASFEALAKSWPAGLEDEEARIVGLTIDVESAKVEWAAATKAEAAGKLGEALDHYLTAERFYAEWRDGEVHVARLRKAIAEKAVGSEGGGS
ncbi:MAG: tetratricopeptide (TPR) repeat protein [Planctomycetota bacterium]|jgi:tetratricopeptide (TPR) repeat protein